jgi:uncharacterized protein with von Willebrand factor type A (vWA) domain
MKRLVYILALALGLVVSARSAEVDPLVREREEQTGTAITILFDNSGSMREEHKIEQAKAAFQLWLRSAPAAYKFSLITFDGQGLLVVPLGENTRDLVAQKVSQLQAHTATPICGALAIARRQIEERRRDVTPYERQVVLIFTDGMENQDARGIGGVRDDILALRALSVEVVGIGFHGQGDYMNGVATRFALAGDQSELQRGLAKVDAEIGGTDDIVVSAEDLAAMKRVHAPAPQPVVATAAEAAPAAEPASQLPPAPEKSSPHGNWFLIALIVFFAVRWLNKKPAR